MNIQSKTGKASKKSEGVGRRKGKFLTIRELIPLKMMKKMR
ncbi:hypothetical protein ONA24_01380 [Mycoplasmopsis cynos]|nr:hypothetical protein [Mycoplasmopsis cynos]WAM09965.1 hypothetical protein ONA24_01380 [Mycoplasmopsis cynos]